jgi:uncharacterized repeat protein (TIGR02543 family)
MKKYNKLINWGLILNLVGLGFILLLILNSWLGYGYLVDLEILFLFLVLSALIINGYFYLGQLKNLNLVSIFSLIVSILMFFIGFYPYQETPLILVIVGSSLLIYSDHKKQNPFSNNQSNFQISNNDYLKRAEIFLEDNDFTKTIEYCEKALDQNPQLGLAYLFKLLALNEVVSVEQYVSLAKPIEKLTSDPLYKRFKQFTPQYLIEIKEKPILIEFEKRDTISETSNLLKKQDRVENLDLLEKSLIALNRIHPYQNSASLILQLEGKISITKQLIRESKYVEAIKLSKNKNYIQLKIALQVFSSLENYKESEKYIKKIETKLKEIEHLRRVKALKFTGKFAVIAILLSIVFNLTNTFFFKYYTINLVTNGGPNVQPISLRFNEEVDLPDIQKTGYKFDNWFLDESLTVLSDVNKMPAENITLYAGWSVNQYIMTFVTNGGEAIQPITQAYNSLLSIPSTSKTGYTLSGWYRDSAFNQLYNIPSNMPAESLTLYAKWTVNQYSITFVTNSGNSVPNQNIAYGSAISLPTVSRTGYSFGGWFTDPSLNTEFSISTMPAQNLVIYAKWLVNQYTITFITNGAGNIADYNLNYMEEITYPTLTREGYIFLGWYSDINLSKKNEYRFMPALNITLYARWKNENILFASDSSVNSSFGNNIVINGDNIFISAHQDSSNGEFSGSVYNYKFSDKTYEKKIVSFDGFPYQNFGKSLATWGDYLVVGAGQQQGAIYVYKISDPAFIRKIEPSDSRIQIYNRFGSSISVFGDFIAVGAIGVANFGSNSGAVYVYKLSDINYERKILAYDAAPQDYFGRSVAISGENLVIGADENDIGANNSGSAYLYKLNDINFVKRFYPEDRRENLYFGRNIKIQGNFILVSAHRDDDKGIYSGSIYVYEIVSNNPVFMRKITASDGAEYLFFGENIDFYNDTILVGSFRNETAYVYKLNDDNYEMKLKAFDTSEELGYFGVSVAIYGSNVVVGSSTKYEGNPEGSGSAFVFSI